MTFLMYSSQPQDFFENSILKPIRVASSTEETLVETTSTVTSTQTTGFLIQVVSKETTPTETTPTETTSTVTQTEISTETQTTSVSNSSNQYVVKEGDTLWSISQINGISIETLKTYNGITDDNIIVGSVLSIPTTTDYGYGNNNDEYYSYGNVNDNYNDNQVWAATRTLSVWCSWESWYNVQLAMDTLNGFYLAPGESFSWARDCGANSAEEGYIDAGVYIVDQYGNTVTSTAPGGGVCLVSTCMMQTARAAGCIITEKHDHSMPVSYAVPGDEASVSYGSWDLQFYNPSSTTGIVFTTWYDNSTCSVTITATPT